jgi:hypothetical protein
VAGGRDWKRQRASAAAAPSIKAIDIDPLVRPVLLSGAMVRSAAAATVLSLVACGGATADQLRARAAFDLNCPQSQVNVVELDERTRGVRGCGQQATYVENCSMIDGYGGKHDCTWVLNTDSRSKGKADADHGE